MANRFPDDKTFAFSIFDDTDFATLENVEPVYSFLADLGLRTTKSVWPLATHAAGRIGGDTLQAPPYLAFILDLKRQGFEIGFHNARNYDSPREITERGLEEFRRLIGRYRRTRGREHIQCFSPRCLRYALRAIGLQGVWIEPSPVFADNLEKKWFLALTKRAIRLTSSALYRCSGRRILYCPNLLAFGRGPADLV